jgi:hypothetical protein
LSGYGPKEINVAAEEFYSGQPVGGSGPWVEWDGSNEGDVVEWLNTSRPEWNNGTFTYAIEDDQLVLTSDRLGAQPPVAAHAWIQLTMYGLYTIAPEQQGPMWKTNDPLGRPTEIEYLLAPEVGQQPSE